MRYPSLTQRSFVIAIIALIGVNLSVVAEASSTPITQVVNSGLLSMVPSTKVDLSPATLSHTQGQGSSGTVGQIAVDDSRGTYAGWSLTATLSNLVSTSAFADDNDNAPFTVSGTYNGSTDAAYDLTTGSGSTGTHLGQMTYTLNGPGGQTSGTLHQNQQLGSSGLSFTASDIDYPVSTVYHLHVYVIGASNFLVTPKSVMNSIGSLNGVTTGMSRVVGSPTDPITLASAGRGFGDGYYTSGATLILTIPPGAHAGTYSGQIVETLN